MQSKLSPWLPLTVIAICLAALGIDRQNQTESSTDTAIDRLSPSQPLANGRLAEPVAFDSDDLSDRGPMLATSRKQPLAGQAAGEFRGDWGELPIYLKDDRVIYNNVEYRSLESDNQNHPPAEHPQFWEALKQLETADAQACLAMLPGSDMRRCDFSQGDGLKNKNLRGAVISNARLSGELGNADLSGANLSEAAVIGSLVIGPSARADHANLSKLQSDGNNPLIGQAADFNHSNFTAANLAGAKLAEANLSDANLSTADLSGAQLSRGLLSKANMQHSNLSYADLNAAELSQADLSDADLSEANLSESDFSGAKLAGARLAGSDLAGSDFRGADLSGAILLAAKNTDSALIDTATDFSGAVCPDGAKVDGHKLNSCIGHGF